MLLACTLLGGAPARAVAGEARGRYRAPGVQPYRPSAKEQAFLDELQRDTFRFFWEASPAATGLTPDRAPGAGTSSVAAVGFALTAYLVGVERGYVTRAQAAARTRVTLETLWRAPQGPGATGVAGHHGLFYHFVDGRDGLRSSDSELSTIDTALLMAGVLAAGAYFDRDDEAEASIRSLADDLYRRVNWAWASSPRRAPLLSMGWTPEGGYLDADWSGYNEGMLLYVLALGSPTHPVDPGAWDAWTRTYRWESSHGPPHVTFGPLFGHQYSHVWIDFRGIQDRYMRSRQSDYFENSVRATYANRAYCIANPGRWTGYGELLWGVTASDGPLDAPAGDDARAGPFRAYWARGAGPDASSDDGTIAPTAAGGSVPFAPEAAIPTLVSFRERFGERLYGRYGFKDAFNLSYPAKAGGAPGWFDDAYLGIDQGPILLMVENYRTGFVWDLLKKSPYVSAGLRRAGFTGGWLESSTEKAASDGRASPRSRS
ncbi:MAG TPA: glucoamylase family protein [Anaeromyxobacteraceae bacterium]|nr:glucoamylase family protein [Anaeromyxobacteraceae bacterium]